MIRQHGDRHLIEFQMCGKRVFRRLPRGLGVRSDRPQLGLSLGPDDAHYGLQRVANRGVRSDPLRTDIPMADKVNVGGLGIFKDTIDAARDRIPAIIDQAIEDAMNSPPMTEARARALILGADAYDHWFQNGLAYIDGKFTADQLEAFAWWLRNKNGEAV